MALRATPGWLQGGSHTAEDDRLRQQAVFGSSGVLGSTQMQVTAQGSPNMTVNVSVGWASILGTAQTNMGAYEAYNDAITILTITTANATLPRIDRVVVSVNDAFYTGNPSGTTANTVSFQVLAGTPNASPVAPTIPANSISLATIAVGAAVSNITSGNITDTRSIITTNLPVLPLAGGTLTGALSGTSLTLTSNLKVGAGAGAIAPVSFQSGSVATLAGGNVDYDGLTLYMVPNATATTTTNGGRGVVPATHYYHMTADYVYTPALTNATFGASGTSLALAANTLYEVDAVIRFQFTIGTTSTQSNIAVNYSGTTSSVTSNLTFRCSTGGASFAANTSAQTIASGTTGTSIISTSAATSVAQYVTVLIKGSIRTATAGNLQVLNYFSQLTGVTASRTIGSSYIKVTPVGGSATSTIGSWV